jgi:hypothetical protein
MHIIRNIKIIENTNRVFNERYHTAGAALKLDRKIVETGVKSTSLTYINMAASCPVLVQALQ